MRKKLFSILFFLAMIFGTSRIAFANEQISAEISGDGQLLVLSCFFWGSSYGDIPTQENYY